MPGGSFSTDVTAIAERARQETEEGTVTASYAAELADLRGV